MPNQLRRFLYAACATLLLTPLLPAEPTLAGDWQGTLDAGNVKLRLVLHITQSEDHFLAATLDSIDQGAMAIPVTSLALDGSRFLFIVNDVHGNYVGAVNADLTRIEGTWTQAGTMKLDFSRIPPAAAKAAPDKAATPSEFDGAWAGALEVGTAKLRVVLRLITTAEGLDAQLQSPDQSPEWIPASSATHSGSNITVGFQGIAAQFEGNFTVQPKSLAGTFTQNGMALPLTLVPKP